MRGEGAAFADDFLGRRLFDGRPGRRGLGITIGRGITRGLSYFFFKSSSDSFS